MLLHRQHPHRRSRAVFIQHRHPPQVVGHLVSAFLHIAGKAAVIGVIHQRQQVAAPVVIVDAAHIYGVIAVQRQIGAVIDGQRGLRPGRIVDPHRILLHQRKQRAAVVTAVLQRPDPALCLPVDLGHPVGLGIIDRQIAPPMVIALFRLFKRFIQPQDIIPLFAQAPVPVGASVILDIGQDDRRIAALLHQKGAVCIPHRYRKAAVGGGRIEGEPAAAPVVQVDLRPGKIKVLQVAGVQPERVAALPPRRRHGLAVFAFGKAFGPLLPIKEQIPAVGPGVCRHLLLAPYRGLILPAILLFIPLVGEAVRGAAHRLPAAQLLRGIAVFPGQQLAYLLLGQQVGHRHLLRPGLEQLLDVVPAAGIFPASVLRQLDGQGVPSPGFVGLDIAGHILGQERLVTGRSLRRLVHKGQGAALLRRLYRIRDGIGVVVPVIHGQRIVALLGPVRHSSEDGMAVHQLLRHIKILCQAGVQRLGGQVVDPILQQFLQRLPLFSGFYAVGGAVVQHPLAGIAVDVGDGEPQAAVPVQLCGAAPALSRQHMVRRQVCLAKRLVVGQLHRCIPFPGAAGYQAPGQGCRQQQRRQRHGALSLFGSIKNRGKSLLQRLFAAGKVGGKQGAAVDPRPHHCQQAAAVLLPKIIPLPGDHRLIAGKLQIPVGGPHHAPDHRIEPVDGVGQQQRHLVPDIVPAVMHQLMPEHHQQLLRSPFHFRQQQNRAHRSDDHRTGHPGDIQSRQPTAYPRFAGRPLQQCQHLRAFHPATAAPQTGLQQLVAAQLPQQKQHGSGRPAPAHQFHYRHGTGPGGCRLRRLRSLHRLRRILRQLLVGPLR